MVIKMACPYRHREVSASDIISMDMKDVCKIEVQVSTDLSNHHR